MPGILTDRAPAASRDQVHRADATAVSIGRAARCSGTGGSTETNGCEAGSLPLGTLVEIRGASRPGTLVYNSWLTMQAAGETDPDTCQDGLRPDLRPPTQPFRGGLLPYAGGRPRRPCAPRRRGRPASPMGRFRAHGASMSHDGVSTNRSGEPVS